MDLIQIAFVICLVVILREVKIAFVICLVVILREVIKSGN